MEGLLLCMISGTVSLVWKSPENESKVPVILPETYEAELAEVLASWRVFLWRPVPTRVMFYQFSVLCTE